MTTQEHLTELANHLRNGGWDLRAPQELADMIADTLDRFASCQSEKQVPSPGLALDSGEFIPADQINKEWKTNGSH